VPGVVVCTCARARRLPAPAGAGRGAHSPRNFACGRAVRALHRPCRPERSSPCAMF
jgi:hypothetical protein